MQPRTQDTAAHEAVIERARSLFERDERILACWLEGSFANDQADAWSDVDLHLASGDGDWEALDRERFELLSALGVPLGHIEAKAAAGARMLNASLATDEGLVRVDLFIERASRLGDTARPAVRVLFDRERWTEALRVAAAPSRDEIRAHLEGLLIAYFFGAMWPVRLWGREQWATLQMNATAVVAQFLIPAMLAQDAPEHALRDPYHNERLLPPARQREIEALSAAIATAFARDEGSAPDFGRLARVHERLLGVLLAELRAACERYDIDYPDAAERELRDYYRRELGIDLRA